MFKRINIPCGYCEELFKPAYRAQKFCSLKCANLFQRLKFPVKWVVCVNCEKEFVKQYKFQKFCSLSCHAKVNKNNKPDVVKFPSLNDERLAEDLFQGASVTTRFQKRDNVQIVQISSTNAIQFLKKNWPQRKKIPRIILENESLKIHFVRGLFDTEGTIGFKIFLGANGKYIYRQLTFTNYNKSYRNIVYKTLKKLGFKPTKPARNIYISNKEDIRKYFQVVGTHNPKMQWKGRVESYKDFLAYKAEKDIISLLFDNFKKYGGVAEHGLSHQS